VYDLAAGRGLGRSDYAVIATMWEEWCATSLAYHSSTETSTEAPR
jgi:hypothetical protein